MKPLIRFANDGIAFNVADDIDEAEEPAMLKFVDKFDVLADVFEFLQIGGGFEWSKSKYSSFPIWRFGTLIAFVWLAIESGANDNWGGDAELL